MGGDVNGSETPPSLSLASADTVYAPHAANDVTNGLVPKAPKPEPVSKAQPKPTAVSALEGSVAAPVNVTFSPASVFVGLAVREVIVGATFVTWTIASATSERPPSSMTRTFTVGVAGPSGAENVTDCPGVSKVPLPSRSQAYVSGSPSGSVADADNVIELPSATE